MVLDRAACAAVLSAAFATGCLNGSSAAKAAEAANAPTPESAGTLSVTALRFSGWHDESFHYVPELSVTAPPTGRPVLVQRVDFTDDASGTRHLLKGIPYQKAPRVQPGNTVELVSDTDMAGRTEIASPFPLASISVIVLFVDDEGQSGLVSAVTRVPEIPAIASLAALEIREFAIDRRQDHGRFFYWPKLTLAETSGRSRASIKRISFELLGVGGAGQVRPLWSAPQVAAGATIRLVNGENDRTPWFEIDSAADASGVSVAIAYVDDAGRGGLVSAIASVKR